MLPNAGRKVLLWAGVFLTGYFAYVLFDRLYVAWLTWQSVLPYGGTGGFWDVELGLAPIVAGEALALAAAAAMLAWNARSRARPTTEATYLFWAGLGVMAYFGSQLVVGLTRAALPFSEGGYAFEMWLQPAVPFVIGLLMVVTAIGQTVSARRRSALPAAN